MEDIQSFVKTTLKIGKTKAKLFDLNIIITKPIESPNEHGEVFWLTELHLSGYVNDIHRLERSDPLESLTYTLGSLDAVLIELTEEQNLNIYVHGSFGWVKTPKPELFCDINLEL